MPESRSSNTTTSRPRRLASRAAVALAFAVFILLLLEGAARTYLSVKDKIPFFAPASRHILRYYPELEFVERQSQKYGRGDLDILMLGASVLHNPNQDAAVPLQMFLAADPAFKGKKIHIYNIAKSAQTTRDSLFKYEYLAPRHHFDLVIVYHAINDTRANNCPPGMFREDYSHYSWYDELNFYHRYRVFFRAGTYIPYFFYIAARRIEAKFSKQVYVPTGEPKPEWVRYGADVKSAESFRRNMEGIAAIAARNRQKLLLVTFASLLPKDYNIEKFRRERTNSFAAPVELWGAPANVVHGISTHNEITREVAAGKPGAALLDMARLYPYRKDFFIDICHFSDSGMKVFDYLLEKKISEMMKSKN